MRILNNLDLFQPDPKEPLFLGIGNFDGLHLGHQKILDQICLDARQSGGRSGFFTFRQHPQSILHPKTCPALLSSPEHRLFLFHEKGLQDCFFMPFTEAFSQLEPEVFAKEILVEKLKVKKVFLGYNAHFGRARKGDARLMAELAKKLGFEFEEIAPVEVEGDCVSSSRIRKLVAEGNLKQVEACLGRPFSVLGKVVKGSGRGKALGFPTANLEVSGGMILPPKGVYAAQLRRVNLQESALAESSLLDWQPQVSEEKLKGVLNYGTRPTFEPGSKKPILEVFLLDFEGDLYGETLELTFKHPRLREEKAFDGTEALKTQISQDIDAARQLLP